MGLKQVFRDGATTVFNILQDVTYPADIVVINDDGWGTKTENSYSVDIILDAFEQDDIRYSIMSKLIQPTDTKGLIAGNQIAEHGIEIKVGQLVRVNQDGNVREFNIVGFETDPAQALYTCLLRDA